MQKYRSTCGKIDLQQNNTNKSILSMLYYLITLADGFLCIYVVAGWSKANLDAKYFLYCQKISPVTMPKIL